MVKCLENENVEYIFGIPGEENLDLMDSLLDSDIQFIQTRDERGVAFMADVYGRLTGRAGVCLSTLASWIICLKTLCKARESSRLFYNPAKCEIRN